MPTDGNTYFVAGATGNTGGKVARLLLSRGQRVRALVHGRDERSESLSEAGAEVVVGDLLDLDAVRAALEGTRAGYFVYPVHPGFIQATAFFAQAAHEANLAAIVNMSQVSARRDSLSHAAQEHWVAERLLDRAPVPVTHLRPTFFAEWFTMFAGPIAQTDVLRLPLGRGRHAPISGEDQAHVIAEILMDPEPHAGQTYPLYGPVEMDHFEIAAEISRALGRTITYEPIDFDPEFADALTAADYTPHRIQHLRNVCLDYEHGIFAGTNDIVERVGKRKPLGVAEFIGQHRELFDKAPAAVSTEAS
ncbi:NmrA family NAD(P)-binding protein [Mycolicibacterium stellerae]|uniref:NmrA family NAD(P)-binding protein n=1 Tax=Mycolicibacterium stellerae TaxID=2358193 RepID=UPI000F0B1FA8|nr:NmrA family NAD(P)-binding protein [Mycolicibacterium stellerae]